MTTGTLSSGNIVSSDKEKYRVIQELGRGGNCIVYLVVAVSGVHHGVLFALKIFTRIDDAKRLERFNTETDFLHNHSHPALMKAYDRGLALLTTNRDATHYPFVVVDYYTGTLDTTSVHSRLPEKVIYMMQLLSGLKYLSTIQPAVVHRDIKPKNIFLRGKNCCLGDFGLMKTLSSATQGGDDGMEVLLASEGPGMPRAYRTPDLVSYARGESAITPKSDIFQLGLVGAEMFTGRNPLRRAQDRLDPIILDDIGDIPGSQGKNIQDALRRMLVVDLAIRVEVLPLMEQWESIFQSTAFAYDQVEGRVF